MFFLVSDELIAFRETATVSGPGSLMLCLGRMAASMYLPTKPGVSVSYRRG